MLRWCPLQNYSRRSVFTFGVPLPQGPSAVSPCILLLPVTALKSPRITLVARWKLGNVQGHPVRSQRVFGGVDRDTGDFFVEIVPRRDTATLTSVIQRNILPDTCIWSDEWQAYHQLGYVHETVNHSQHLVNPVTGVQLYMLTTCTPLVSVEGDVQAPLRSDAPASSVVPQ